MLLLHAENEGRDPLGPRLAGFVESGDDEVKMTILLFAASSVLSLPSANTMAAQTGNSATVDRSARPAWSGSYLGLQFGGHFTETRRNGVAGGALAGTTDLSRNGTFGGIQFGDGRELRGWYAGVEADSAFGRFVSGHIASHDSAGATSSYEAHRRFVGTVRGKAGRAFGRWLFYGTGGLALGGLEQNAMTDGPAALPILQFKGSTGGVEFGYAVGGGAEYRASRRLSYAVESLYYRLQNKTVTAPAVSGSGANGSGYAATLQNSGSIVRVGANFHF